MLGFPSGWRRAHQTESRLPFSHPVAKSGHYDCDAATGGVVEWLMAPVLKTGRAQALVGSNPTPSALKQVISDR
jgi:hypothetical protein